VSKMYVTLISTFISLVRTVITEVLDAAQCTWHLQFEFRNIKSLGKHVDKQKTDMWKEEAYCK
jgi:hypothetical protein